MGRLIACICALSVAAAAFPIARQGGVPPPPPPPPPVGVARDAVGAQGTRTRVVPIGTAALGGLVTSAATGRPLANVRLTLTGASGSSAASMDGRGIPFSNNQGAPSTPLTRMVVSDNQGRFLFDALPAGRFTLTALKEQYVTLTYGALKPNRPGTTIPVAEGQHLSVAMALSRGGVISGTVYGSDGEPMVAAQVRAFRLAWTNGVKRPLGMGFGQTDDRGAYRLINLTPGDYLVAAAPNANELTAVEAALVDAAAFSKAVEDARQDGHLPVSVSIVSAVNPQDGPPAGFANTYYPNAGTLATASPVSVAAGEERAGIDITTAFNRTVNLKGIVAGIPSPNQAAMVSLVSDDPMAEAGGSTARTQSDGNFVLRGVVPGRYTLVASVVAAMQVVNGNVISSRPIEDRSTMLWGRAAVVVDGPSMPPVVITLQAPRSVSGIVEFPADMSAARRASTTVSLFPTMPVLFNGPAQARVAADGRFTVDGLGAGVYSVRVSGGPVKSAMLRGQDLLDFPLVFDGDRDETGLTITLEAQPSQLSGMLTDASGAPVSDCTIVVASADRRYWTPASRRIVTGRPGTDGRYTFSVLPAGDYLVAAVTDLEPGSQFDPEFLGNLANAAVRVTIPDGGRQTQDLRLNR